METEQQTQTTPVTVEKNTVMAVLSYIGPLVVIPYLTARDDGFVRFHIQQGLVLLVIGVALWVIGSMLFFLWPLIQILNLAVLVLAVIGIINAVKGAEKSLPLVGKYSSYFKI